REVAPDGGLPHRLAPRLGHDDHDPLAFLFNEVFDQHETDECLAEADSVAEESAAVNIGDAQQLMETVLLVLIEDGIYEGLGFEVDAATDLARANAFDNSWDAEEKIVLLLFAFEAFIECLTNGLESLLERTPRAYRDFVAHEDADVIDFLPFAVKGEQGSDF